ncbi:MAG: protein kinase [Sandaracinaceae bacterium]|nr:protein kinase [Sandaracinaceae bacterium]
MSAPQDDRIAELARRGDHREAAALALASGDPLRAAALFAEVWDWSAARRAAERAGEPALAYRYAVSSNDAASIAQALAVLLGDDTHAEAAAAHARERGRHHDAARLLEASGRLAEAADAFVTAGDLFDAARCHEALGGYREAGKLYERRLKEAPEDARAALRLARILASFGRYKPAVAALQSAERDPEHAPGALRMMVACFAALQLDEAAGRCLERLRTLEPAVPVSVREYLERAYGHDDGLLALQRESVRAELLAGRYQPLEPLGSGATGRVLRARDTFYDRDVAVKVLSVGGGERGRDAYARFAREARIATALDHPNIVRVLEFHPNGPFLVMELMGGGTLERRLVSAGTRLPLPVVAHVLRSLTAALGAVHQRGVTHRDVKPANVFFGDTGEVKLGDFGASHLADLSATLTSAMVGTVAYMAPEQVTGGGRPSAATDLYALGVVAFQMLTGRLPFEGPDFVTQHLSEAPPLVSTCAPVLGTQFDALLGAMLEKDPHARVQDANTLHARLDELTWVDPDQDALSLAAAGLGGGALISGATQGTPAHAASDRLAEGGHTAVGQGDPLAPDGRFVPLPDAPGSATDAGVTLMLDTLVDRQVQFVHVDAARARALVAFAGADHPHLQAVFDVDATRGQAVLEWPLGTPALTGELSRLDRLRVKRELEGALAALHARGLAHGQVDAAHVRVGPGRAVLLLPSSTGGDAADDRQALELLFA